MLGPPPCSMEVHCECKVNYKQYRNILKHVVASGTIFGWDHRVIQKCKYRINTVNREEWSASLESCIVWIHGQISSYKKCEWHKYMVWLVLCSGLIYEGSPCALLPRFMLYMGHSWIYTKRGECLLSWWHLDTFMQIWALTLSQVFAVWPDDTWKCVDSVLYVHSSSFPPEMQIN